MKNFVKKYAGFLFYLGLCIGLVGMALAVFEKNISLYLIHFLFYIPSSVLTFPKFLFLLRKDDRDNHEGNMFVMTIVTFLVYLAVPIKYLYEYLTNL